MSDVFHESFYPHFCALHFQFVAISDIIKLEISLMKYRYGQVMMMRKLRSKIIATIVVCVLIVAVSIGLFSHRIASGIVADEASEKFYNISKSYANEFSLMFCAISNITDTIAIDLGTNFDIDQFKNDPTYRDDFILNTGHRIQSIGAQNDNIQGIYVALDPTLTDQVYESWFISDNAGSFLYQTPEDISEFYPENEDMGWFYEPFHQKKGVWSEPYTDATLNVKMISYTTPIIVNQQVVGIVGIDICFESILDIIDEMRFYDNGYPFLIDNHYHIITHPDFEVGTSLTNIDNENLQVITDAIDKSPSGVVSYVYKGNDKLLGYSQLINGWYFLASAEVDQINAQVTKLSQMILILSILIAVIAMIIGFKLSSYITKPLNKLIKLADQIGSGDYHIGLHEGRNDEIGHLFDSFYRMSQEINANQNALKALTQDMTYQAYHDPLTRLPNRRFAQKRLHAHIESYTSEMDITGIMLIDLNDFKSINDTYGHNAGDQALIHATEMMHHSISENDELFRFGGDEFLLIFKQLPSLNHIEKLVDRIWNSIRKPIDFGSGDVQVSASIGITILTDDNSNYDILLKQTDIAMYHAKKTSGTYQFYQDMV